MKPKTATTDAPQQSECYLEASHSALITPTAACELDQRMVAQFWDAEWIFREADSEAYVVFPREPHDDAVAANVGATIAPCLTAPLLVWRNDMEQN